MTLKTILFLIFALVASFGVANKDLIRNYFENLSKRSNTQNSGNYQSAGSESSNHASFQEQLQKAYDDLKAEFEIQKKKFQSFLEEQQASQEKPVEKQPEETPKE